ncbi:putative esterase of the alpha-beta hydrolase superfamily [Rickettsia amblyommatis str. Ac/Pa]|uniref:Putative esterase of the alpha-beta hydrolase superfamily n=1 Tax=Rickettsia amblyommatis str. Ac/Pa TaxID=1359164 RepID=A0A0F3N016_RICAM|nr:putative esterase of the alpha-beta hydrolase superfamily [Rickettsia amblyommatis str. Ac/Pa]
MFDDKTAARSLSQTDNKNYKTLGFKPINKEILEAYQNGTEPKPFCGYYYYCCGSTICIS